MNIAIQIQNSYKYNSIATMTVLAEEACKNKYYTDNVELVLNRPWYTIYIEWWLHNIGYYITLPFIKYPWANQINERCKHVDLERWK